MSNRVVHSNMRENRVQSVVLIFAMVGILALVGAFFGGLLGVLIAMGICVFAIIFGPAISPNLILSMYKAQPLSRQHAPQLYDLFTELVRRAELPRSPTLHYIPSRTLNAFAVGRQSNSAVAITDGLLRILNARELAGVLAHEVSHIRHRDMLVLGIADTVSRTIATLSQIGQIVLLLGLADLMMRGGYLILIAAVLLIASPVISNLLQLALSRSREFHADMGAVALTGDAEGLASALAKLERVTTSKGFPWIVGGRKADTVPAVLRTHPPTEERVRRILQAGESLNSGATTAASAIEVGPQRGRRLAPQDHPRYRRGPRWHVAGLWY